MLGRNILIEYESIPYGEVTSLLPIDALPPASYRQHAVAEGLVQETQDSEILAVAPESMATGYRLAGTPLTAIRLDAVPAATYTTLAAESSRDLTNYTLLILGRPAQHTNHTLREFA